MKKNLSKFMAACLGRQQQDFSTGEIVVFYAAFIFLMSMLSYLQGLK
jgi:hypothetical protein